MVLYNNVQGAQGAKLGPMVPFNVWVSIETID